MTIEEFFRLHYRGIVGYCSKFWHNYEDVEEMASDVIFKHFDEYAKRIPDVPNKWNVLRRWMSRRVLWDLGTEYRQRWNPLKHACAIDFEVPNYDTPESILDLKQRLPHAVPDILFEYEPNRGIPPYSERKGKQWAVNTPKDRVDYCRAKKRFLKELSDGCN